MVGKNRFTVSKERSQPTITPIRDFFHEPSSILSIIACLNIPKVTPRWGSKLLAKNGQKWQFLAKSTFGA